MINYPRLTKRLLATTIDNVITAMTIMTLILLLTDVAIAPYLKIMVFILPIIIFEPLLVSLTGGSIGHHYAGIRVRQVKKDRNINFIFALIRFILKILFSWASILFVLTTKKHQALHDKFINCLVINKNTNLTKSALSERVQEEGYLYPIIFRKIFIIIIYNIVLIIPIGLLFTIALSDECFTIDKCNTIENLYNSIISLTWITLIGVIISFGWNAKLFGCMKKEKK